MVVFLHDISLENTLMQNHVQRLNAHLVRGQMSVKSLDTILHHCILK